MKKSPLSLILLPLIVGLGIYGVYAATLAVTGTFGVPHSPGVFLPGGNAGSGTFMNSIQLTTAGIDPVTGTGVVPVTIEDGILKGNFFLQTVGYVSFDKTPSATAPNPIKIVPPDGTTGNAGSGWMLDGTDATRDALAWSDNAGWINLESLDPTTYSGVYYLPDTGAFTGFAWSDTLGYIDFAGTSSGNGLLGRVKVLGNAGGTKTFDSLTVSTNGLMRTNSVLTPYMNTLHKNVALLTRNVPNDKINLVSTTQNILGNVIYYRLSSGIVKLSDVSFCSAAPGGSPRSLIVDGGDILIDQDVTGYPKSCAIIALSNGTTGGNIYISSVPKKIYSYVIAEGSIYSGLDSGNLYNDTKAELTNLPVNQLYVLGGLIGRNTIGGSTISTTATGSTVTMGACPYTETTCNRDTAIKYDFNFLRNYIVDVGTRGYKDASLDQYSLIIESDSRAAGDPPPGL